MSHEQCKVAWQKKEAGDGIGDLGQLPGLKHIPLCTEKLHEIYIKHRINVIYK